MLQHKDGVRYAMLGDPGRVAKWLQVEGGAGAVLSNPAVLSGVGGLLTQFSQQAEAHELKALLVRIDEQLDDVRRAQRDMHLAKLDGAGAAIAEAMIIRAAGGDPATLWAKIQAESGAILDVQAFALRALDALADKGDGKRTAGARKTNTVVLSRSARVMVSCSFAAARRRTTAHPSMDTRNWPVTSLCSVTGKTSGAPIMDS